MRVIDKIIDCLIDNGYEKDNTVMRYKYAYDKNIDNTTIQIRFIRNIVNIKLIIGGRIIYTRDRNIGRDYRILTNLVFDLERLISILKFY